MKSTHPDCAALLQSSDSVFMVELVTVTLVDTTTFHWCNSDISVSYGATTWSPGPIIERDTLSASIGVEVVTCNMTVYADDNVTVLGLPLLQAARSGVFDGAMVKIEKGFTDNINAPLKGTVHMYEGRVGDISVNSASVQMALRSFTELLDTMVPLDVYQPTCTHVLYSAGCGLSKAANSLSLSVQSGSTRKVINCVITGSGEYELGELVFTSGANNGVRRSVKVHTSGQLTLSFPLPNNPVPGDTFTVSKGCNKTRARCDSFSNTVHFRGMPYVPQPETAV